MSASVKNFKELVDLAYAGRLKLPAFQRKWRWQTEKVKKLFDSLRQRYPIGSLLFLGGEGAALSPRTFYGSSAKAGEVQTENLVLDGQQRITAGICLFYATGSRQYFLDLARLAALVKEQNINLKDKAQVKKFAAELDIEDGYLVAKPPKGDPRALLITHRLLSTSILADGAALPQALLDYAKKFPDEEDLLWSVVQPYFNMSTAEPVPYVTIDAATQLEAISRIFTTLNTTGQLLTPFELVVAILYPKNIDLVKEYKDLCIVGTYYPNMDKTGEILLQTIAMLAGVDPKKANLPKTITPERYQQHKYDAFEALEDLGAFLTHNLGAGLDVKDAGLIPYDAIYAPMACAFKVYKQKGLKGAQEAAAKAKFAKWFVGCALVQRYQEGVHNKQRKDYTDFLLWLDDDGAIPTWITEVQSPIILRASIDGAIGKVIQCLINSRDARDPITNNKIGYRSGTAPTEKHHIFPTKYLPTIEGWKPKQDSGDNICNMMYLQQETNKTWINGNPADHVAASLQTCSVEQLKARYEAQFISKDAYDILAKAAKTKKDYETFSEIRQASFRQFIKDSFGFAPAEVVLDEDIDEEE